MRTLFFAPILAILATVGCSEQQELYCTAEEPCSAGYEYCDVQGACPESGFHGNTCISTPCWDARPADAAVGTDGNIDGAVGDSAWDIAYINDFGSTGDLDYSEMARIINTGTRALDLSGLEVVSVTHSSPLPLAVEVVTTVPTQSPVPVGHAVGLLSSGPAGFIDPLISEPVFDESTSLISVSASGFDVDDPGFTITAVVRADGRVATMSIAINVGAAFSNPSGAERVPAL